MAKYDNIAKTYHEIRIAGKAFYNEYYEVPAMLKLLPKVSGKNVLDLGCGSGVYTKILLKRGAKVVGVDISKNMIDIAKIYAPGAKYLCQDMAKLRLPKNYFDIAFSSLAVPYLVERLPMLKAVYKSLKKNGVFLFSITNPLMEIKDSFDKGTKHYSLIGYVYDNKKKKVEIHGDYFKSKWVLSRWRASRWGRVIAIRHYHRTLEYIINTCVKSGFNITGLYEPQPINIGKKYDAMHYKLRKQLPYFMILKLQK